MPSLHSNHFTGWLLRPYIDLSHSDLGPLHVTCLKHGWQAFADRKAVYFHPQRAMAPGFRAQLASEAGVPCSVADPRHVSKELRTDRWNALCEAIDDWASLAMEQRLRLVSLLHSMCFYSVIAALCDDGKHDAQSSDPAATDLAFWCASADYIERVPQRISEYESADLTAFEAIARSRQDAGRACFNATAKVFVHKAKTKAPLSDLTEWASHFEASLAHAVVSMDGFTAELHTSRFYRGMGFLPQRAGDWTDVARLMDLAEVHAHRMKPQTPAQELLYRENMHALMESRTKEALGVGDLVLASKRALKVVEVDPLDAKAWFELGQVRHLQKQWSEAAQAYATAAMLGPPAHAIGRHMAGVCLQELGFDALAASFFKETVECDPHGISPRRAIEGLPDVAVFDALKNWAAGTSSHAEGKVMD